MALLRWRPSRAEDVFIYGCFSSADVTAMHASSRGGWLARPRRPTFGELWTPPHELLGTLGWEDSVRESHQLAHSEGRRRRFGRAAGARVRRLACRRSSSALHAMSLSNALLRKIYSRRSTPPGSPGSIYIRGHRWIHGDASPDVRAQLMLHVVAERSSPDSCPRARLTQKSAWRCADQPTGRAI